MALIFHQLFEAESSTYTYLIGDSISREALLIDPVLETASRDAALLEELGLKLRYTLETHCHADHVTSAALLSEMLGSQPIAHSATGIEYATLLQDADQIGVGSIRLHVLHTPGHTSGDACYLMEGRVFTGDTLLIGGCGRTDFQQGNAGQLYDSITRRLFVLPDEILVYPGHDYMGHSHSTIGEQIAHNPRLAGKSRQEFVEIMDNLGLAYPKQIDRAVPANLKGGASAEPSQLPVNVAPHQFFSIPEMYLVGLGLPDYTNGALPRATDMHCKEADWETCVPRLPLSRTIGLVSPTGGECLPLEAALTQSGYDAVILQDGLKGLHGHQAGRDTA